MTITTPESTPEGATTTTCSPDTQFTATTGTARSDSPTATPPATTPTAEAGEPSPSTEGGGQPGVGQGAQVAAPPGSAAAEQQVCEQLELMSAMRQTMSKNEQDELDEIEEDIQAEDASSGEEGEEAEDDGDGDDASHSGSDRSGGQASWPPKRFDPDDPNRIPTDPNGAAAVDPAAGDGGAVNLAAG